MGICSSQSENQQIERRLQVLASTLPAPVKPPLCSHPGCYQESVPYVLGRDDEKDVFLFCKKHRCRFCHHPNINGSTCQFHLCRVSKCDQPISQMGWCRDHACQYPERGCREKKLLTAEACSTHQCANPHCTKRQLTPRVEIIPKHLTDPISVDNYIHRKYYKEAFDQRQKELAQCTYLRITVGDTDKRYCSTHGCQTCGGALNQGKCRAVCAYPECSVHLTPHLGPIEVNQQPRQLKSCSSKCVHYCPQHECITFGCQQKVDHGSRHCVEHRSW